MAPLDKARCVVQVSNKIVRSINKFWKGLHMKKDKLTIDGDSLLMIYIYLTLQMPESTNLFAHLKLTNEFLTPFVRNTKLGYCLTTLEIALNHVINMSKDELITNNNPEEEL